jgi:TRAP-type C4-dicarboxylate transport system permease small subunit
LVAGVFARHRSPTIGTPVKLISRIVERLALVVLMIGGVGMLMSMFLGVADIVGTQILLIPVPGPRELTESTMVLIVFGALAYAQIRRAHIRVELVYFQMPPRVRAVMDVITDLAAMAFFGLILSQAISEAQYSLQIGEATVGLIRFPLWPARFTLAAGCALMILQLTLHLIQDLIRIKTGEGLENDPLGILQKVE